jgi:LMBR1 domain-containing protein 1
VLNAKSSKIESSIQKREGQNAFSWRLISKFLKFLTPFRIILGMGCLGLSVLVVASIVITNVDRMLNSKCGFSCGYLIEKNTFFNPLDTLLV